MVGAAVLFRLGAPAAWSVVLVPPLILGLASGQGRTFQVMPGREMKGFVVVPDEDVADDAHLDAWVSEALDYTATLPPKVKS